MRKKVLSMMLAGMMLVTALTGCGNSEEKNNSVGEQSSEVKKETESSTEVQQATEELEEAAKIKWVIPSKALREDIEDAIVEYILEKVNVEVEFMYVGLGDYDQKLQVMNAGQDEFDIVFTSNWCNNYLNNIANGSIIALDDLVAEYGQGIYGQMSEDIWDLTRVDGKLYGIINLQIMGRGPCFLAPEITLEKLGMSAEEFTTWKDAEKYFRAIKEKTGEYTYVSPIWSNWLSVFGFEEVSGTNIPGAIYVDATKDTVEIVNQYETEEFKEYIEWRRQMVEEGLTPPTIEKLDNEAIALNAGDDQIVNLLNFYPTYKPGLAAELKELPNDLGSLAIFNLQEAYLSPSAAMSTMNSISATSKNPEAAMKVLELINTDGTVMNLLGYGIEGVDYKMVTDSTIERLPEGHYNSDIWAFGNTFLVYPNEKQPADVNVLTQELNANAKTSPIGGFSANLENLTSQIANCSAVVSEYLQPLDYGVVDIETAYPEFIEKLEAAGVDEIIDELNRQLEEWKSNN